MKSQTDKHEITPTFQAIDGEGTNRADGTQAYTLLCNSSGRYIEDYSEKGLSTAEIFRYLLECSKSPGGTLVGFFIGYDVTKWLHDLSPRHIETLWKAGWVVWKSGGTPYLIEWLPGKVFRLGIVSGRLKKSGYGKRGQHMPPTLYKPRAVIYDVGGFFQCSFVEALRDWGIASETDCATIEEMKGLRNDFADMVSGRAARSGRERVRNYCLLECVYLVRLMDALARALWSAGICIKSWHGAGAVAGALYKQHNVKAALPQIPEAAVGAVMGSYYGGRTELYQQGLINTPVWVYDLQSAYPSALATIANLAGARWEYVREYEPKEEYAIWDTSWDTRESGQLFGPFPYRRAGRMFYPYHGRSWVHAVELSAARCVFGTRVFTVRSGWVLRVGETHEFPFAFVGVLGHDRLVYKAANDARHRVLKLGLNSLYGKLAQKQRRAGHVPPYLNYYVAGLITARTRARLLSVLAACGDGLVMVATDGIFTTREIPETIAPLGKELGSWEVKGPYSNLLTLQSGVLFTPDTDNTPELRRTRGFNKSTLRYNDLLTEWRKKEHFGKVKYSERRFLGVGSGIVAHSFDHVGEWADVTRILRYTLDPTKLPNTNPVTGIAKYPKWQDKDESIYLVPNDGYLEFGPDYDTWQSSEPYVLGTLATDELAVRLAEQELANSEFMSQPDWEESR